MRPPGRAHQLGAQLVQGAVAARPAPLLHRHRLPRVPGAPAPHRPLEGARQSPPEVFQPRAGGPGRLRDVHAFGALDAGPGARARLPLGGAPGAFPLCCGRRPPGPSRRQRVPASRARIANGFLFPSARKRAGAANATRGTPAKRDAAVAPPLGGAPFLPASSLSFAFLATRPRRWFP